MIVKSYNVYNVLLQLIDIDLGLEANLYNLERQFYAKVG